MTERLIPYLRCFTGLIFLFSLGMILIYLIPNDALEPQYSKSTAQLEKEELYPVYFFDADSAIMDNFTDYQMIRTCKASDEYTNPITAAFDNNGYPRYWNGYLLTLRPVLSQFTYQQIRYLNMFLLLCCFSFCFSGIHQRINPVTALGFAISIIACFLVLISQSLQYFSVFMILFITLLMILYVPCFEKTTNSALLLFASGMTVNFFDMLTAPLLTLGIPLILIICLGFIQDSETRLRKQIRTILTHSISWGTGYATCWISKWTIGSAVLKTNVFEDAKKTAQFRINGSEAYPLDRLQMLRLNFETYFFAKGHKPAVLVLAVLILLIFLMLRFRRKNWLSVFVPTLIIGIYPYIWFYTMANHSQLHYFYTYRIQAVTLFALFAAVSCSIDWKKCPLVQRRNNKSIDNLN